MLLLCSAVRCGAVLLQYMRRFAFPLLFSCSVRFGNSIYRAEGLRRRFASLAEGQIPVRTYCNLVEPRISSSEVVLLRQNDNQNTFKITVWFEEL